MKKLRIAVPTESHAGLTDVVSEVFGKAKTFTIIDIEDGNIENIEVIENPAASYEYGAGPVAVKTLADLQVDLVVAGQLGPGALNLLKHHKISRSSVESGTKVADCIEEVLSKTKAKGV